MATFLASLAADTFNCWLFSGICILAVYLMGFAANIPDSAEIESSTMTPVKDVPVYRNYTLTELAQYCADNPDTLLIAIEDRVYDVSKTRQMYGNGGPYASFAGTDATYKLARQCTSDLEARYEEPLTSAELENLRQWKQFYESKYLCVGELVLSE